MILSPSSKDIFLFVEDLGKSHKQSALLKNAYDEYTVKDKDLI
jgi:hypothetical protein